MLHTFIIFCLWHLVDTDGLKTVSVMEGDSVTLHTDETDIRKHYILEWWFGPKDTLIVKVIQRNEKTYIRYYEKEIFGDRLQIDNQTGSLTIRNIRTTDSGHYQIFSPFKRQPFSVTVYARLPIPVITRYSTCSSFSGSSQQYCSLLCSVLNVSHVTLSWYKGNSLLSIISVSGLISSVSLPLKVEYQDNDTYSCIVNNPISSQVNHRNISELCQTRPESVQCYSFTEAVIRLVISAVVGVATVAIVVYDIRSRRAEQK
ncbi:hypothetical protein QQF64_019342 [Cirrhinus molitorella]|uniref:Ig-like domain-containing protein n=1 Tax=Cirrhinus molitorella TaxID=172907 RepID=A0ABR3LHM0_9TELE